MQGDKFHKIEGLLQISAYTCEKSSLLQDPESLAEVSNKVLFCLVLCCCCCLWMFVYLVVALLPSLPSKVGLFQPWWFYGSILKLSKSFLTKWQLQKKHKAHYQIIFRLNLAQEVHIIMKKIIGKLNIYSTPEQRKCYQLQVPLCFQKAIKPIIIVVKSRDLFWIFWVFSSIAVPWHKGLRKHKQSDRFSESLINPFQVTVWIK